MSDPLPAEVPVALLSEALVELRQARGNSNATREAAIRYFKSGIAKGFQVGPLLQWLLLWPSNSESVFWQVHFPANEGRQFIEMLKKLSLQDLGFTPEEEQALLQKARSEHPPDSTPSS